MSDFLPYLVQIGQFLFALTVIVGIHEFGHFITAKWTGMRVEKFFIGFPPTLFTVKKGDTVYGLGVLLLGGFVKVTGIIDESLDSKSMKTSKPEPYEYRAKNPWQRLLFLSGGIIMNLILAIVIYSSITYAMGEWIIPKKEVLKYGIHTNEISEKIGLKKGDKILKVNGENYYSFTDLLTTDVFLADNAFYEVERGDAPAKNIKITIPPDFIEQLSDRKIKEPLFDINRPYIIKDIASDGGAKEAGLLEGDKILTINGENAYYFQDLIKVLSENKGKEVEVKIERQGEIIQTVTQVSEYGKIGIVIEDKLEKISKEYGLFDSLVLGVNKSFGVITTQVKAFRKMFRGEIDPTKSLAGPIRIVKTFSREWNWLGTLHLIGLLSMAIGFMNLLPIPALDGGHITFTLYEIVSGKKPSVKVLEYSQKVGIAILLALMIFVFGNDILSFF